VTAAGSGRLVPLLVIVRAGCGFREAQLSLRVAFVLLLAERGGRGNQKAGEVPAGGGNVENFADLRLPGIRTDEVEPDGAGEPCPARPPGSFCGAFYPEQYGEVGQLLSRPC
jgi:hypothetical protein